ncbi:unnamed protein product [Pieris macdunnoughi]|uniref:Uncharacterized protein n=1 Tax=Pieris macdunnoughi TaxID=345717 RepID=A0A821KT58_9NEOP|nr:unnamed protein product [Pieris macdunnoughi]
MKRHLQSALTNHCDDNKPRNCAIEVLPLGHIYLGQSAVRLVKDSPFRLEEQYTKTLHWNSRPSGRRESPMWRKDSVKYSVYRLT